MLAEDQSKQAEKTPENNTGNPLLIFVAIVAAAATATAASLFGLHAVGAAENKNKNRAAKIFTWFQRKTGDEDNAQQTEKQMALHNVVTGAKIVANKVGDCAIAAGTVVGACVEQIMPK